METVRRNTADTGTVPGRRRVALEAATAGLKLWLLMKGTLT